MASRQQVTTTKENIVASFGSWLASSPLGTALKSAVAVVLSLMLTEISTGAIDFANWQTWIYAALGAALPILINALNPRDVRYGRGKVAK